MFNVVKTPPPSWQHCIVFKKSSSVGCLSWRSLWPLLRTLAQWGHRCRPTGGFDIAHCVVWFPNSLAAGSQMGALSAHCHAWSMSILVSWMIIQFSDWYLWLCRVADRQFVDWKSAPWLLAVDHTQVFKSHMRVTFFKESHRKLNRDSCSGKKTKLDTHKVESILRDLGPRATSCLAYHPHAGNFTGCNWRQKGPLTWCPTFLQSSNGVSTKETEIMWETPELSWTL